MKRPWLANVDWSTIIAVNAALCQGGNALHKPTSDGYDETEAFWQANFKRELCLLETGDRVQTPKGTLTGTITRIASNGDLVWKCDQTGAEITGASNSFNPARDGI